ncbi:MAG: S-layer protein, partial [Bacteroidota bacterium]
FSAAQTGCPGCQTEVPAGLPADTVYLPGLPDGQLGAPYDESISFRLPKTTTPVYALDSVTQPGLAISKFEIVAIDGLPAGLHWQPNKSVFDMTIETDGCLRICGTPFEHDSFSL